MEINLSNRNEYHTENNLINHDCRNILEREHLWNKIRRARTFNSRYTHL